MRQRLPLAFGPVMKALSMKAGQRSWLQSQSATGMHGSAKPAPIAATRSSAVRTELRRREMRATAKSITTKVIPPTVCFT